MEVRFSKWFLIEVNSILSIRLFLDNGHSHIFSIIAPYIVIGGMSSVYIEIGGIHPTTCRPKPRPTIFGVKIFWVENCWGEKFWGEKFRGEIILGEIFLGEIFLGENNC